jgi:hypothetical protein
MFVSHQFSRFLRARVTDTPFVRTKSLLGVCRRMGEGEGEFLSNCSHLLKNETDFSRSFASLNALSVDNGYPSRLCYHYRTCETVRQTP